MVVIINWQPFVLGPGNVVPIKTGSFITLSFKASLCTQDKESYYNLHKKIGRYV